MQHYTQTYDDFNMHNENLEYTNDNFVNDMLHVIKIDTIPRR